MASLFRRALALVLVLNMGLLGGLAPADARMLFDPNGTGELRLSGLSNLPPAVVVVRNIASNVRLPGFNGSTLSNGTDTTANMVSAHWNESGKDVTEVATLDYGRQLTATNEADLTDPFTITRTITYPFNTTVVGTVTWAGVASKTVAAGSLRNQSDWITLTAAIPAGAKYGVHTFITVASGQKYPSSGNGNTGLGERKETGTGLSDKTQTLGVALALSGNIYRPAAVLGRAVGLRASVLGIGDSFMVGATDGLINARGGTGAFGRAAEGVVPFAHAAVTGTKLADNFTAAALKMRLDLAQAAGITHVVSDFGSNDNGGVASTNIANHQSLFNLIAGTTNVNGEALKVIQSTLTPASSSTDNWTTLAGQTPTANYAGASSTRGIVNDNIRSKPSPLFAYIEVADAVEPARYDGRWGMGSAFSPTHLRDPENGVVGSGSTTTAVATNLTNTTLDFYRFSFVKFTSGALAGSTLYYTNTQTGTTNPTLNLSTTLASAPAAGDTFIVYPIGVRATTDGLHASVLSTAGAGYGAIFIAADAIRPTFQGLTP